MGCGCGGARRQTTAQQQAAAANGGGVQYEVTYNDGGTERFDSEPQALAALAGRGGGLRTVARSG